jgi:hypothetical protein
VGVRYGARRVPRGGVGGSEWPLMAGRGRGGCRSGGARAGEEGGRVRSGGAWLEESEGARGPAQEKEKRAGPKGIVKILIYSNNLQTSSNCFDQKVDLPSSRNFK